MVNTKLQRVTYTDNIIIVYIKITINYNTNQLKRRYNKLHGPHIIEIKICIIIFLYDIFNVILIVSLSRWINPPRSL